MNHQTPRALTNADDATLTDLIARAQRRVVYMAPALSGPVGQAIGKRWLELGAEAVTVVVDVDEEAYRLGYGSFDALTSLQAVAHDVGGIVTQQPGVRLGLLISDDQTLIWAPVAQLIETGSSRPQAPNAIRLGLPPADVEADLGQGADGSLSRTVGLDPMDRETLEKVDAGLKISPPQKFDVARQMRVFNAFFEFVEFRVIGAQVGRRTVPLPSDLTGVADAKTQRKLTTAFRLLDPQDALSGDALTADRNAIEKRHLRRIGTFGLVIKRTGKEAFLKDVEELRTAVEEFEKKLKDQLDKKLKQSQRLLAKALLPAVKKSPPARWRDSCLYRGKESAEDFLDEDLTKAFGKAHSMMSVMKVEVIFKNVHYDSLKDARFMAAARGAFPELKELYVEQDAAPAAPPTTAPLPH